MFLFILHVLISFLLCEFDETEPSTFISQLFLNYKRNKKSTLCWAGGLKGRAGRAALPFLLARAGGLTISVTAIKGGRVESDCYKKNGSEGWADD
jgi:hypothetical protein